MFSDCLDPSRVFSSIRLSGGVSSRLKQETFQGARRSPQDTGLPGNCTRTVVVAGGSASERVIMMYAMALSDDSPPPESKVVGDMTLEEARHLLQCEGGELSAWDVAVRVVSAAAVAGLTARAIVVGDATVWHLALPMLARSM
jgi:hypothetical protein